MQSTVEVHEAEVVGSFTVPEGPGPHPGVVALSGSGGDVPGWWGDLLAPHGLAVLSAAYFGVEPLPSALCEIPVETLAAAAEWLRKRPGVRSGPAGLVGGSKGAELALLAATAYPGSFGPVAAIAPPRRRLTTDHQPQSPGATGSDSSGRARRLPMSGTRCSELREDVAGGMGGTRAVG